SLGERPGEAFYYSGFTITKNQSVVRQPNVFKSERPQMSKQQFSSQVDVNKNLSRPVTQHYLPKKREFVFGKPDHMIAPSESRNISKNMPRFCSNAMVLNYYLDESRKTTQERDRNSKTSVISSTRFQSTTDGSKQKPRSNNQTSRSFPVSKSSRVTITAVPKQITLSVLLLSHIHIISSILHVINASLMQIMMLV
nr:hypothetical protein [Tanacetum cinerariifolium]